jgi:AcrR family transcriptional regulator
MADIVTESGLSNGAIYRYFTSKDEIVVAVCEQASEALPKALTVEAVDGFLEHVRTRPGATVPACSALARGLWHYSATARRANARVLKSLGNTHSLNLAH